MAKNQGRKISTPGMSRHIHNYDEEGRLIESKLTMTAMEAARLIFAYDEFGNKLEEVGYSEDGILGSKAIFTREYDEYDTWAKEIVTSASDRDAEAQSINTNSRNPPGYHLVLKSSRRDYTL